MRADPGTPEIPYIPGRDSRKWLSASHGQISQRKTALLTPWPGLPASIPVRSTFPVCLILTGSSNGLVVKSMLLLQSARVLFPVPMSSGS